MKLELLSASNFLVHLVRLARRGVSESQLARFHDSLIDVLRRRYRDHWFPDKPFKGSGFRCIRINGQFDQLIGEAGEMAGLSAKFLHTIFPSELTLWVDPLEVSYRIGENGSICVLYEYQDGVTEPWKPNLSQLKTNQTTATTQRTQQQQQGHYQPPTSYHQHQQQAYQQQQHYYSNTAVNTRGVNISANSKEVNNCKESLRTMDYLLIDRKSASIEQLAAYVSS
eukprot:TRINITY_DN6305_c0_g1_i10.p1 TRINITY_DN6305_c0_g1~~TRINITY_DN6305_c0_g1_i10.p1  ORF type:complete len:225 (+),score=65.15 TRINITY_DN6305_c0_g1_i10:211-885(+)